MLRTATLVLAVFALALSASPSHARSARTGEIPNGSAASCGGCHVIGPPALNAFGAAIAYGFLVDEDGTASLVDDKVDWGAALAAGDADEDGYANGLELGDPEGTWRAGEPNPAGPLSNPGEASSTLCGTGAIEGPEECDGQDVGGLDCGSFGGPAEVAVACLADCTLDLRPCAIVPEDDVVVPGDDAAGPDAGPAPVAPADGGEGEGGGCGVAASGVGLGALALLALFGLSLVLLRRRRAAGLLMLSLVFLAGACGSGEGGTQGGLDLGVDASARVDLEEFAADVAPDLPPPPPALATCVYVNPFSQGDECKEYTGGGWTLAAAEEDCAEVFPGRAGEFTPETLCQYPAELGRCTVVGEGDTGYALVSAGADEGQCALAQAGCEVFGGGSFAAGGTCEGVIGPTTGGGYGEVPFIHPYLNCVEPLPGEPAGQGPDGKVCTWTIISGCTEPGRRFDDYASCEDVFTQRPYYAAPDEPQTPADDPRLEDSDYQDELTWVRSQVEACACICCHSTRTAPDGPSMWWVEAEPLWIDSVADSGLSMMAGLSASDALGAVVPAADNNGFDRVTLGLPTSDIPRMTAFLEAEWARRGFTREDGANYPAFGGPIVDQQRYMPSNCAEGVGVDAEGRVQWTGGEARYVYVLEPGSANPGVPPNLDEPEGTLWLLDVPHTAEAMASGLVYGEVTGEQNQRVPAAGAPPALVAGRSYYLYVLKDIGFPLARCLFTYPGE